jgi:hypothetical protein
MTEIISQSNAEASSPAYTSLIYNRMRVHWELPLALMGGTLRMRELKELYLPKHEAESKTAYNVRLARTTLRNFYLRTVDTLVGKVFAKDVVLTEEVPPEIAQMLEDVDLTGRHINIFARDVFSDAIATGISYIVVDYPVVEPGLNIVEERKRNLRPYAKHVKAVDLLGFDSEFIDGVETLTAVRIRENYVEKREEWIELARYRIRILRIGSWELWESNDQSVWTMTSSGLTSLTTIPICAIITKYAGFMEGRPPLEDLAWMNLEHYQIRSDQRVSLSVASFPILAASGWNKEQDPNMAIHPYAMLANTDPSGRFYYVESGGAHLKAGAEELEKLENSMRNYGLQFENAAKSTGGSSETATGRALDAADGSASLHSWSMQLGDALECMLQYFAMWLGIDPEKAGSVMLNDDYDTPNGNNDEIQAVIQTRKQGDLTQQSFLEELVRRGVLKEDFDIQTEIDNLKDEMVQLGAFEVSQAEQFAQVQPPAKKGVV